MRSKIKKNINPRILFRIGIVLLMCFFRRAQRLSNICLTCIFVPAGLGVKLAERSDKQVL